MAVLNSTNPTMLDLTKLLDPNGSITTVAEILNETNEGLDEMTWMEGNLTTGHRHSVRTGLPSVVWGQLYKGVPESTGTTAQVTDTCGFLESRSSVDTRLVELAPDPMQFRFIQDRPHVESMSQEFFSTLFKGKAQDAEKFIGLEERFSDTTAANGDNILVPVETDTDLVSIWLIGWSPRTIFGIVPKGTAVGLQQKDEGEQDARDASNNVFRVLRTYWRWNCGIAVPDWRYIVRAQVDVSELTDSGSTGVNLPFLFHDMMERMPSDAWNTTRVAFYTNRQVITKARKQLASGITGSTLALRQVGAVGEGLTPKRKFFFDDIPMNRVDALTVGETFIGA